jgi:arginyl-tRNA synthetase
MLLLKDYLDLISSRAFNKLAKELEIKLPEEFSCRVDYPPANLPGEYAIPNCLELAKTFRKSPREIATKFCVALQAVDADNQKLIANLNIEGPGFVNIEIQEKIFNEWLGNDLDISLILKNNKPESGQKSIIEFVSANPTGPLNIVSARAAALGDTIVRIKRAVGEQINSEYYVNNFGNQVRMLGVSLGIRVYNVARSANHSVPKEGYQGEYLTELAKALLGSEDKFKIDLSPKEADYDSVLRWSENNHKYFSQYAVKALLRSQKLDLEQFNVSFDNFFMESDLHEESKVDEVLVSLQAKNVIYEKDGAAFYRSTNFGDDKDRVVKRADGRPTYLLADIAYHKTKFDRGFNNAVDIWGPDHHGYISRLSSAVNILNGEKPNNKFKVLICQQVNLLEDGRSIVMSKRLGKFHTMRDLLEKIPVDVLRFFFIQRSISTHLDFDLSLALDQSSQNPVYYIQYAHARICSILAEFDSAGGDLEKGIPHFSHSARNLFFNALRYPEEVKEISNNLEVQRLPQYLYDLASTFTTFYHDDKNKIKELVISNKNIASAYLKLCQLIRQILAHGLDLIGVSAPERM